MEHVIFALNTLNRHLNDKWDFICASHSFHNVGRCVYRDDYEETFSQLVHMKVFKHLFYVVFSVTLSIGVFKLKYRSGDQIEFLVWQRDRYSFRDSIDCVSIYKALMRKKMYFWRKCLIIMIEKRQKNKRDGRLMMKKVTEGIVVQNVDVIPEQSIDCPDIEEDLRQFFARRY